MHILQEIRTSDDLRDAVNLSANRIYTEVFPLL
jgi:hypothetical protein